MNSNVSATFNHPDQSHASPAPIFGSEAQKLIACNQKLQELGIDGTIKVPRIVVIGDQSTGKSSLIEAISSISVPKAAGLCTKCPIAINLINSDNPYHFECAVSIEEKYEYDQKKEKITKTNPLGPWQLLHSVRTTKVDTTNDRHRLCDLIEEAQKLVLRPLRDSDSGRDPERFSPNIIRVDITATGWVNLSFVDLPGVISHAGRNQPPYHVKLVESLAKQYAQDVNNVIMLTLPLNHDDANSKAYGIVDSEHVSSRTIAVFTKVDIASSAQRDECLEKHFSPNSNDEFQYGQHIVMLDPGKSEDAFFTEDLWKAEHLKGKLGIKDLIFRVRDILFRETQKALPHNLEKIRSRLHVIVNELRSCPPPPDLLLLPAKLREQLYGFRQNSQLLFSHTTTSRGALNKRMELFSTQIIKGSPVLRSLSNTETKQLQNVKQAVRDAQESENDESETDKAPDQNAHVFALGAIRGINQRNLQSNSSSVIEPKAIEELNRLAVKKWAEILDCFTHEVHLLTKQHIKIVVDATFGQQSHFDLYDAVQNWSDEFAHAVFTEEKMYLERKCRAEMQTPYVQDTLKCQKEKLASQKQTTLDQFNDVRKQARLKVARAEQQASALGTRKKLKLVDEDTLEPDPWKQEVEMGAASAAYYAIASHRFIDNICQDLLSNFVTRLQNGLEGTVTDHLGLNSPQVDLNRLAELMSEDPERVRHRQRLEVERENLIAGQEYISTVLGDLGQYESIDPEGDTIMNDTDKATVNSSSPAKRKAAAPKVTEESPTKKGRIEAVAERESKESNASSSHSRLPSRGKSCDPDA